MGNNVIPECEPDIMAIFSDKTAKGQSSFPFLYKILK
jgi:hypothetical protein